MPPLRRLDASPLAKMMLAALVFCLIVGGWLAVQQYRQSTATLPDDNPRQGACSLWFVGSSSMHRWTSLGQDMAPWTTHNRGIDNATFADLLPRFANAKDDPRPAAIILYAGENDIANGTPVRTVIRELAHFLDLRSRMMGDVPVLILSMKPSPTRWSSFRDQQLFNAAAQRLIPHARRAYYADIAGPLLKDGRLGHNYHPDGVHMNPAGYRIWAGVVRRRLGEILPADSLRGCAP